MLWLLLHEVWYADKTAIQPILSECVDCGGIELCRLQHCNSIRDIVSMLQHSAVKMQVDAVGILRHCMQGVLRGVCRCVVSELLLVGWYSYEC